MSLKRCLLLTVVIPLALGCGTLSAQISTVGGGANATRTGGPQSVKAESMAWGGDSVQSPISLHPEEVYPQIVRLSLVQGDVRVAVGKQKGQPELAPWVEAVANMPLESGFSVVTGKGRAEIEFEDASTMYLGENSALTFNTLTTKNGVPSTDMVLLTGVASLHLRPTMPGERYDVRTPTDAFHVPYGSHSNVRLNSYMDAMTVTPQAPTEIHLGDVNSTAGLVGKTFTYSDGVFVPTPPSPANNFAAWDKWVAARIAARNQAIYAVMKESGLKTPLPGMADMNERGSFFECQPYGTCWMPTNGWAKTPAVKQVNDGPPQAESAPTAEATSPGQQPQATAQDAGQQNARLAQQAQGDELRAEAQTQGGGVAPAMWVEDEQVFPCSPYSLQNWMTLDPMTGAAVVLASDVVWDDGWYSDYGFDWAVCHAGSWIYWHHRYAWVAGDHRHHHCPVHWVKAGGKLGYVPIHPHDREGKDPENLKHGIFVPKDRKGEGMQRVAYEPGAHVKVLAETPKEFRGPALPTMRAATAPTLEARNLREGAGGSKAITATSLIAFDSRARGFTVTSQVNEGGRSHTEVSHVGGGTGGGGGHGFSGGGGHGFSGGGGGHGFAGGGGGGSHGSGGGGSAGGGGGHGGGGSSGGSSSGGGGGSASAGGGGGGGHH
jgi:FecR protein